MEIIQVSATSPTLAVAQSISSVVHEYHCAEVQVIGPEAFQRAKQASRWRPDTSSMRALV